MSHATGALLRLLVALAVREPGPRRQVRSAAPCWPVSPRRSEVGGALLARLASSMSKFYHSTTCRASTRPEDLVLDITVLRWWWSVVCGVVVCVERDERKRRKTKSRVGTRKVPHPCRCSCAQERPRRGRSDGNLERVQKLVLEMQQIGHQESSLTIRSSRATAMPVTCAFPRPA